MYVIHEASCQPIQAINGGKGRHINGNLQHKVLISEARMFGLDAPACMEMETCHIDHFEK